MVALDRHLPPALAHSPTIVCVLWGTSMESVAHIFDCILEESQFDLGHVETARGHSSRSWASRPGEVISVHDLRQLLRRKGSDAVDPDGAREARLICPEETISLLVARLRVLLNEYVDAENDTIGHAFPKVSHDSVSEATAFQSDGLRADSCITALDVFAKALVKGSALVGSQRVASLIAAWVEGQPVRYRTCAILNGINIKASLVPMVGITVTPLPWSSDELPKDLPFLSSVDPEDYLGKTVIYVESEAAPPLFRPEHDEVPHPVQASNRSIAGVDAVCEALALESDDFVEVAFQWNDYRKLREAFPVGNSSTWARSGSSLRSHLRPGWKKSVNFQTGVVTLSPGDHPLSDLEESVLGHTIGALMEPRYKGTGTSATRLIKSKDSRQGLVDQFVDLRMALEALFLKDFANEQSQEMRFRLSLIGAWFLGQDFEDRRRIRKVLRDAYDTASRAVHTGNIVLTDDNRALLADAQSLCREGILKLLVDGPPTDWGDLVLGRAGD